MRRMPRGVPDAPAAAKTVRNGASCTTVFPQQSVNGYIYFALDDPADTAPTWGNTGKKRRKPAETQYRVACSLPAGSKEIAFLPIEGE